MRLRFWVPPLACVGIAVASCGDSPTPADPPPPAPVVTMIAIPLTDKQEGITGSSLLRPLLVEVRFDGHPAPGVPVSWSGVNGTLTPRSWVTDEHGQAQATWQLGEQTGEVQVTARIDAPEAKQVTFTATAVPAVNAFVVPSTTQQVAEVGQQLPIPLAVAVTRNGQPIAGIPVEWETAGGTLFPSTVTGVDGIATARWVLGAGKGTYIATARVKGSRSGPVNFLATATTGPVVTLEATAGNAQSLPPYGTAFQPLSVTARDRFGNVVAGVPVVWSVEQGPVMISLNDPATKSDGRSVARVVGAVPGTGSAVVRASVADGLAARFNLVVEPPLATIYLNTNTLIFVSGWNRTAPAVDTVAIGAKVRWQMSIFDYEDHSIEPDGAPLFVGGRFPYAGLSFVETIFTTAGTYRYIDPSSGARGTIVVR
ncbi:MAG: hypothetical protein KA267_04465 [Gemmatimonadales bacterium]|nr:hypothetical protein [Gemmatimonadales bacterium]